MVENSRDQREDSVPTSLLGSRGQMAGVGPITSSCLWGQLRGHKASTCPTPHMRHPDPGLSSHCWESPRGWPLCRLIGATFVERRLESKAH